MENKDLDRLTRRLMEGTAERPSASLNTRIMALIRQQQTAKIAFVPNMPSTASWLGWFLVYLLLAAGAFYYMYANKLTMRVILEEMTTYLSLVLTCALAVPLYIAGVWLDRKRNKEMRQQEESLQ